MAGEPSAERSGSHSSGDDIPLVHPGLTAALANPPTLGQPHVHGHGVSEGEVGVAEDEAAYESTTHTSMEVPVELVPKVRELIARRRAS